MATVCVLDCVNSTVRVTDGTNSAEEPLVICLTGDNKRPYFINEPYVKDNLASSVSNGSVVIRVQARDDDLQGKIVYEVILVSYGSVA